MTPILLVVAAGFALLFVANREPFDLGVLMFRIDLFAFGGGFASVPLMYHEIVDVRSWMDLDVPWDVPRIALAAAALVALLLAVDVLWVVLAGIAISLAIL